MVNIQVDSGLTPLPGLAEAVECGVAAAGADHATVVITDQFAETVNHFMGITAYDAIRADGVVLAKTLKTPSATVVLNHPVWAAQAPQDVWERSAAHEACHVLMNDRGEEASSYLENLEGTVARQSTLLAEQVIEEYRCEVSVVRELGYAPPLRSGPDDLPELLHTTEVTLLEGLMRLAGEGDTDEALWDLVSGSALRPLAKQLAVAAGAARDLDGDLSRVSLGRTRDHWNEYVAPTWRRRLALFRSLPSATIELDHATYLAAVSEDAEIEVDFLRDLGFAFTNDGQSFGRVINDDRPNVRLGRAERVEAWLAKRNGV